MIVEFYTWVAYQNDRTLFARKSTGVTHCPRIGERVLRGGFTFVRVMSVTWLGIEHLPQCGVTEVTEMPDAAHSGPAKASDPIAAITLESVIIPSDRSKTDYRQAVDRMLAGGSWRVIDPVAASIHVDAGIVSEPRGWVSGNTA